MDAKFTTMDLAQALVRRSNIPASEAVVFVRQFFDTIEEALLHEKIVKVRGFGTFKLISVEARESVSVVDGSRIEIASHTKVSFTPDSVLRDAINKPFAEFETVLLSDDLNLAELEALDVPALTSSDSVSYSQASASSEVEEVVLEETEDAVSEVEDLVPEVENSVPEEEVLAPEEEEEVPSESLEEVPSESREISSEDLEVVPSESPEAIPAELLDSSDSAPESVEESVSTEEAVPADKPEVPADEPEVPAPSSAPVPESSAKHHCFWPCFLSVLLAMVLFVAGYCVGYHRPLPLPDFSEWTKCLSSSDEQPATNQTPSPEPKPAVVPSDSASSSLQIQVAAAADSTAVPATPQASAEQPSEVLPSTSSSSDRKVPSETLAYPQLEGGDYWIVGVKATEIMKPGRTLLNFSLKYYKSKDFVPYICTMNDIKNPDIVPLNKELRIPELRKK